MWLIVFSILFLTYITKIWMKWLTTSLKHLFWWLTLKYVSGKIVINICKGKMICYYWFRSYYKSKVILKSKQMQYKEYSSQKTSRWKPPILRKVIQSLSASRSRSSVGFFFFLSFFVLETEVLPTIEARVDEPASGFEPSEFLRL